MRALTRPLAAVAFLFLAVAVARSEDPAPPTTTLTVPDLDCPECAKKLTKKLLLVAGVAKAEADVEKTTVTVTPKTGEKISPKALWEATDKGGFAPRKLVGPDGTFKTKPTK